MSELYVLTEGEKVLSVGVDPYIPTAGQKNNEILLSDWEGKRKSDVYWDGEKVCLKSAETILAENKKKYELLFEEKSRKDIISMGYEYPAESGNIFSTSESKQRRLEALDGRIDRDKVDFANGLRVSVEGLKQVVFIDKVQWQEFADGYFTALLVAEQNIIVKKIELGLINGASEIEQWADNNL